MFLINERVRTSKHNKILVDKPPINTKALQDYLHSNYFEKESGNYFIFAIKSQSFYFEKVTKSSAFYQIVNTVQTDINQFEPNSTEQRFKHKNIFILVFPFSFKQISQLQRSFCSNIKFIPFDFIKCLRKLFTFDLSKIYNIKKNTKDFSQHSTNLIAIYDNFKQKMLLMQSINSSKTQLPIQCTDIEDKFQQFPIPTVKKAKKNYQFVDDTVLEIHDPFSVIIRLKNRFKFYGMIIYSNDTSRKKSARRIKMATKQVLNNFDLYKFIVPVEKQVSKEKIETIHSDARNKIKELKKLSLIKYCDSVTNSELKQLIFEMNLFVQRHSKYISDLKKNWKHLAKKISGIEQPQMMNDSSAQSILQSFRKIKKYNQNSLQKISYVDKISMTENVNSVFKAVNTYLSFMLNEKSKKQSKKIEKMLFNVVFNPNQNESFKTNIFSVYEMHDTLINTNQCIFSISSSTGSGKTRCSPFFFAIKAIEDDMNRPFIIMTQPRYSIIRSKISDFKNILGDSVKIIINTKKILKLYERYSNNVKYHFVPKFNKPILFIMTSQSLLELIQKFDNMNINICSITRFCLDEVHERSVESDVLEAILASKIRETIKQKQNFPLQLLMMSATPDSRVYKCFDYVSQIKLPESYLYPIETIPQKVDNFEKVNSAVVDQTFEIINKMADGSIERGHIIIFTSGYSRMKMIKHLLIECIENNWMLYNCCLKVIRKFDSLFVDEDVEKFYSNLNDFIEIETQKLTFFRNNKENILFILPIFYLGYVSNGQKEICLNPIYDHPNVIKIIFATNAIESSVTIKDLVGVVDSGLYNHQTFNVLNGLSNINEETISIESQIQRKGRVGRMKPGISVQITLKNQKLLELLPPAIQTSDISFNILYLRQIGYKLEEIENLPDKISENEMNKYILDLELFNAISKENHELTPFGEILLKFEIISPYISAAILSVSGYECNDEIINLANIEENEIDEKELRVLLGCLISLIFNSTNLITNIYSCILRKYFDKRSDIITLLRTFIDLVMFDKKEILANENDYGLESKKVIKILEQLKQIGENLFFSKDQIQYDQPNDSYIEQKQEREEEKEAIWKKIFESLNEFVIKLVSEDKLYSFIQELIDQIGKNKPEWIESRKVQFESIIHASSIPVLIYQGNDSLSFAEKDKKAYIRLQMRPGSIGLDSPGKGIIFSITHDMNAESNYGYLIHSEDQEFVPHPISVKTTLMLNNDFTLPLLEGYFEDDVEYFKSFYDKNCNSNEGNIRFYESQEKITDTENQQVALISFIPNEEKSIDKFNEIVKIIEKLLPYVPSTILIPHTEIGCVVSLYGKGTNKIESSVHMLKDEDYFAYRISKETIEYLHDNIDQLQKCPDVLSVAIMDESLSYPLSENCGTDSIQNNYLAIVSSMKIEAFDEKYRIPLMKKSEDMFDSQEKWFLHTANHISERTITFRHAFYRLIFTNYDSIFQVKGKVPNSYDVEDIPNCLGQVSRTFYKCAQKHINGDSLNSPLQFQGFYFRGKKIQEIPEISDIEFASRRYIGNSCYCLDVKEEEKIDFVQEEVMKLCENDIFSEIIPVFSVFIRHRTHSNLSQTEFTEKVNSVLDQFGGIILKRYDYSEFVNKDTYQGMIKVLMYCVDFTIPLAGMIQKIIQESEVGSIYNILNDFIDPVIFNDDQVQKSLKNWFSNNNIDIDNNFSIINNDNDFNNIEKVMIEFKKNPPEIPFQSYPIPEEYNILQINHYMKYLNRIKEKKWYLNKIKRTLFAPTEVKEEEVIDFLNKFQEYKNYKEEEYDDHLLWELYLHDDEEPTLSRYLISIFTEDGNVIQKNYCVECVYQSFLFNLRNMHNKDDDSCSMMKIYDDILPLQNISFVSDSDSSSMRIPLGQMIWSLIKEPKIANQTRTWMTAIAIRCLRRSTKITFCPLHPYILLPAPPLGQILDCSIPSCPFCYCFECHQWHHKGKCEKEASLPAGSRICPFCHETVEKMAACNHIHCNCGKDFCYHCGEGFESSNECYAHMDKEKHWEDAPDYLRFIMHQSVEDKVLLVFYEKYPKWKPEWLDEEI